MTAAIDLREDERDRRLVERHQAGDSTAFAELYALHYARLIRFCRRLVSDPHLAEEIAQDAFLRAYTALDRLGGERRFYPWLTVIARRLVIDHMRRHGRVQPQPDLDGDATGAAEDIVVRRLESRQLRIALDRVRDRHRQVLHLRDWEGLSYNDIADRLGIAPTAIPPLLHRARAALRREYLLLSKGRVAALLPVPTLLAASRRVRDRLLQWSAWMPEAGGLSAPVASMVLSLGTLAASLTGASGAEPTTHQAALAAGAPATAADDQIPTPPTQVTNDEIGSTSAGTSSHGGRQIVPGVAEGSVTEADPDGVRRVKEEERGRPLYFHNPYIGFSWDPADDQRRVREMLEGTAP